MANIETFDRVKPAKTVALFHDFYKWAAASPLEVTAKAAWDYQQKKIAKMESEMAYAICNGEAKLKETIYDLDAFIKKQIELIEKLDKDMEDLASGVKTIEEILDQEHNKELKERINGQENIG